MERKKTQHLILSFVGCQLFILNTKNQLVKFDLKVDKGIFLGYYDTSKACRVLNSRTLVVEEFIHVKLIDELTYDRKLLDLQDD